MSRPRNFSEPSPVGASHQRADPLRASPYDTVVFVLQTERGSRKWPADGRFEAELRAAFAASVPLSSAAERQERKRKTPRREPKAKRAGGGKPTEAEADSDEGEGGGGGGGGGGAAPSEELLAELAPRLDAWVAAKRSKDFATADKIRDELKAAGVIADKARPVPRKAIEKRAASKGADDEKRPPKRGRAE